MKVVSYETSEDIFLVTSPSLSLLILMAPVSSLSPPPIILQLKCISISMEQYQHGSESCLPAKVSQYVCSFSFEIFQVKSAVAISVHDP